MKALITLILVTLVVGQITASDSRLSPMCLNGVTSRFECCKGVPNAWYAHLKNPKDCGTFYQCDNGEPVLRDCPEGLEWSVAADRCEHPKYARCSSDGSGSSGDSGESGELQPMLPEECYEGKLSAKKCCKGISAWWVHLPDPKDCRKFYHCDNGKAVHKDCPANLHWSVAANRCEWPHLAGCQGDLSTGYPTDTTQKPTEPTTKPTEATKQPTEEPVVLPEGCYNGSISAEVCCVGVTAWWVHLPDPENCGKFYQCDNGQAVHKDCPAGLHWSVTADRCEWADVAGCQPSSTESDHGSTGGTTNGVPGESSTPETPILPVECYDGSISAEVCCVGVTAWWVHLPDPENCGKFYQCDNGQAVHKDCPAGLHWSVTADRCEWPDIAGCQPSSTEPSNKPTDVTTDGITDGTTAGVVEDCSPTPVCHQCYTGVFPAQLCCEGIKNWQKIHLAHPQDCTSYYDCINEAAILRKCPEGLHWSINTDRCEWPTHAQCSNSTGNGTESGGGGEGGNNNGTVSEGCLYGEVDPNICCEDVPETVDVLLQNNNNCHTYYQCVHGKPKVRPCPANLWWSVKNNRCEWRRNATCTWEIKY